MQFFCSCVRFRTAPRFLFYFFYFSIANDQQYFIRTKARSCLSCLVSSQTAPSSVCLTQKRDLLEQVHLIGVLQIRRCLCTYILQRYLSKCNSTAGFTLLYDKLTFLQNEAESSLQTADKFVSSCNLDFIRELYWCK